MCVILCDSCNERKPEEAPDTRQCVCGTVCCAWCYEADDDWETDVDGEDRCPECSQREAEDLQQAQGRGWEPK